MVHNMHLDQKKFKDSQKGLIAKTTFARLEKYEKDNGIPND